ncbi:MAG TPA: MinD/ParA family protein [Nevskiaceae bacterium]|nr:MinD/ParA family protein [Nevskiaceae bacterium]
MAETLTPAIATQAAGLQGLTPAAPVQVIAVTSGKGGVGKTSVSVNLSVALAMSGRKTLLLDGDLGLANVDVMLGLQPTYNLSHVLAGRCSLDDTLITGPAGLLVAPATSGKRTMAELSSAEHAGIVHAFSELKRQLDVLVIDTAAGIADSVITFSQAAQQVIVVVCNDPSSITDAYALIKVLNRDHGVSRIQVLANMVGSLAEARELHENLRRVAERFLDVTLNLIGCVPQDDWLRRAVRRQRPVVEAYPNAPSAEAFRALARKTAEWGLPSGARGNLEFFVERLIGREPLAGAPA